MKHALLVLILICAAAPAEASEKERRARILTYGPQQQPGIESQVTEYSSSRSPGQREVAVAEGSRNRQVGAAPQLTLVANRCTGLTAENSFSAFSNSTTCTSFAAPAPPHVPNRQPQIGRTGPTPEQIAYSLARREIAFAPKPRLRAAPAGVGLTGLDSFFWLAEEPQPISATAGVVTAEARPIEYSWDFDDGSRKTTSNSGRPWTRRRAGNIAHLYETRGSYGVSVDVIWEARWRLGAGEWRFLGYFTTSDAIDYPVRQVVALLVKAL